MGRLSGFRYHEITRRLKIFGFELRRAGKGSHQIWANTTTQKAVPVPNHPGDMPEGTLRSILKQADISVDDFLEA